MSKRAPSTTQLLVIAGFALSCFGILLFLWITFGGPTPFKAKPYEVKIPFNEATQLAQQSDVRISGVSVGKVQDIVLSPDGEQAMAKIDIDDKYGADPARHPGDPAHEDAARRDLHRTHPRRPQRAEAGRRRHPAQGADRRIGPARRDLPHLRRAHPRRLPDLAAGRRDRDRGPRRRPLLRLRRARTRLHPVRPPLPPARQPAARGQAALPQRRHLAARPARPPGRAGRPDPKTPTPSSAPPPPATARSKRSSAPSPPSRTSRG